MMVVPATLTRLWTARGEAGYDSASISTYKLAARVPPLSPPRKLYCHMRKAHARARKRVP